jgi:hypothetical protein
MRVEDPKPGWQMSALTVRNRAPTVREGLPGKRTTSSGQSTGVLSLKFVEEAVRYESFAPFRGLASVRP